MDAPTDHGGDGDVDDANVGDDSYDDVDDAQGHHQHRSKIGLKSSF